MNFGELKDKVAGYLNRDDLTAQIPDFIIMAQRKIERGDAIDGVGELKNISGGFNCMRVEATGTLTTDSPYLAFPTRYKSTIDFRINNSGSRNKLYQEGKSTAINIYPDLSADIGEPLMFSSDHANSRFILRPTPDSNYTYYLEYYNYLTLLSADSNTNWWTDNAWEILLYAALLQAEPYMKNDARITLWGNLLKNALNGLIRAEKNEIFAGSSQGIRGSVIS